MITDRNIIDIFYKNDKLIAQRLKNISIKYTEEYLFLLNRYSDSDSIHETLYRIKNNIDKRPVCEVCGAHVGYLQKKNLQDKYGQAFKHTCSRKCGANSNYKKNNLINKYGVDNVAKAPLVKNKIKQTCLNKYGNSCAAKAPLVKNKARQTCLDRYNNTSYLQSNEYKSYILNNYFIPLNITNFSQLDLVKNKIKNNNINKYGVEYYSQTNEFIEKYKQTCLEKYGVDNPLKSEIIKDKIKQTCLEKYGVEYYTNRAKYHKTIFEKYNMYYFQTIEFQQKSYQTKKKNNSFSLSKPENKLYEILCEKFGTDNVIRQYKSDLYPFPSDFYIRSLDLYIEYQGNWSHGKHPFDETNPDDLKIVELWKQKSEEVNFKGEKKKFYLHAIKMWTKRDVEKRYIAKQNNLNYIEIWNISEIENIINLHK